jgi:hypothetical protein
MGSFFSVLALSSFARIGFASQLLPQNSALQGLQFILPAALLLSAGLIAAAYVWKRKTVAT